MARLNLAKALATVSGMTLISRILGFVRDTVIARIFGAGLATDAFFVAFRIPNLLRRLFAEGALSQAFVPIFSEYRSQRGEGETRALVDHVAGALALILFVITLLGVAAAPVIIYASAPGFHAEPEKFALAADLLRITFPYIFFISLVSLSGGILNSYSRFAVPAITPALLNLSFIGFALWAAPYFDPPIKALAWAVFCGGALQLAFQVPFLMRLRLLPRFKFALADTGMRRVARQMGPAIFGVSASQLSLLINTIFASFLATGSVSWLYYADRLMEFPTALLGVALGTVLLPSLSQHHTDQAATEYSKLLDWGLRLALMLALPAACALALLAVPLIATLFYYGEFSVHAVAMTRDALIAYSVGLLGLILVKVLAPGFYAKQDIRTPVRIAIVALVATQVMNLILVWPLQHVGLALSISLGACLNAALLFFKLRARSIYTPQPGWGLFAFKVLVAIAVMTTLLWIASGSSESWLAMPAVERIWRLLELVIGGAASYFATLWLLGFRPRDFTRHA